MIKTKRIEKQLIDLLFSTVVNEYRGYEEKCVNCGYIHKPEFTKKLINNASYGDNLKALVTVLNSFGLVSINRTQKIIKDLSGGKIKMSESTVCNILDDVAKRCKDDIYKIKTKLLEASQLCEDDTTIRANGKNAYVHVVTTKDLCVLEAFPTKSIEAKKQMGVLDKFKNCLTHDHNKGLYQFDCVHSECNQHVLRYLKGIYELEGDTGWAKEMSDFLKEVLHKKTEYQEKGIEKFSQSQINDYTKRYHYIIQTAKNTYKKKDKYNKDAVNLYERLEEYSKEHLLFMNDFNVPFTNNTAESRFRIFKTKHKVSGSFNTLEGANNYCHIYSILESDKKDDTNRISTIKKILNNGSIFE